MRIEFKAYGGTGELIGRSFVVLMALNACNLARNDAGECVIYRLDFDDNDPNGDINNDYKYLSDIVEDYKALHERGLDFLAPISMKMDTHSLKAIRAMVYPQEEIYSLRSIYIDKTLDSEKAKSIENFLTGVFTSDEHDPKKTKELERSNRDGNYGDLAVNSFINERIITENAYEKSGIYNELQTAITSGTETMIFYAGSTDGGTANTNIDKDIQSLLNTFPNTDHTGFKLYALRTTPYSKFEQPESDNSEENAVDRAITARILKNKFQMAKGVLERIEAQNNDPNRPNYYDLGNGSPYWLDGLFFGCSNTLDVTAHKIRKDNQFHPTHFVEFGLAKQAMDAIAQRLPATTGEHLYVYNDGGGRIDGSAENATPETFFANDKIKYVTKKCLCIRTTEYNLSKIYRSFLLTLTTIQYGMIPNLIRCKESGINVAAEYLRDLFCTNPPGLFSEMKIFPAMPEICGLMANDLNDFIKQCKFIVMAITNMMEVSSFNMGYPVKFAEPEIKYLYDTDFYGNPLDSNPLTITTDEKSNRYKIVPNASGTPSFPALKKMPTYHFEGDNSKKDLLKSKKLILSRELAGKNNTQKAVWLANDMITRIFELYLTDNKT